MESKLPHVESPSSFKVDQYGWQIVDWTENKPEPEIRVASGQPQIIHKLEEIMDDKLQQGHERDSGLETMEQRELLSSRSVRTETLGMDKMDVVNNAECTVDEIMTLHHAVDRLTTENEDLTDSLNQMTDAMAALQAKLIEKEHDSNLVSKERDELMVKYQTAQTELAEWKRKFDDLHLKKQPVSARADGKSEPPLVEYGQLKRKSTHHLPFTSGETDDIIKSYQQAVDDLSAECASLSAENARLKESARVAAQDQGATIPRPSCLAISENTRKYQVREIERLKVENKELNVWISQATSDERARAKALEPSFDSSTLCAEQLRLSGENMRLQKSARALASIRDSTIPRPSCLAKSENTRKYQVTEIERRKVENKELNVWISQATSDERARAKALEPSFDSSTLCAEQLRLSGENMRLKERARALAPARAAMIPELSCLDTQRLNITGNNRQVTLNNGRPQSNKLSQTVPQANLIVKGSQTYQSNVVQNGGTLGFQDAKHSKQTNHEILTRSNHVKTEEGVGKRQSMPIYPNPVLSTWVKSTPNDFRVASVPDAVTSMRGQGTKPKKEKTGATVKMQKRIKKQKMVTKND